MPSKKGAKMAFTFKKTAYFISIMSIVFLMENSSLAVMKTSWIAKWVRALARGAEITNRGTYSQRFYPSNAERNLLQSIKSDDHRLMKAVLLKSKPNLNEIEDSEEFYASFNKNFSSSTKERVYSALMVAAAYNRIDMILPLVEAGANPNYVSGDVSALMVAIYYNNFS
jgi:hypothetical protein